MARPMATRCRCPPESCARLAVEIVGEVEHPRRVGHLLLGDGLVDIGHLEREGDVLAHRHVRVERVGLEHHGEAAMRRRPGR